MYSIHLANPFIISPWTALYAAACQAAPQRDRGARTVHLLGLVLGQPALERRALAGQLQHALLQRMALRLRMPDTRF